MTFAATLPGAALARRAATGLALAMLAVGGAGAVTIAATASAAHANVSTAATTSTSSTAKPAAGDNGTSTAFGQQVKAQVATCKADLQSGQHGIGSCVSAWVTSHNPSNTRPGAAATGATAAAAHRNR